MQYAFDVVKSINMDLRNINACDMFSHAEVGYYITSNNVAHRAVLDKLVNKR